MDHSVRSFLEPERDTQEGSSYLHVQLEAIRTTAVVIVDVEEPVTREHGRGIPGTVTDKADQLPGEVRSDVEATHVASHLEEEIFGPVESASNAEERVEPAPILRVSITISF